MGTRIYRKKTHDHDGRQVEPSAWVLGWDDEDAEQQLRDELERAE